MKRFVNGVEADLVEGSAEVFAEVGRLRVTSLEGEYSALAIHDNGTILISFKGRQYRVERRKPRTQGASPASSGELRAPMPGQIVDIRLSEGDHVRKGDTILVLEAMKTQQPFQAPFEGTLAKLFVEKGGQVAEGAVLALIEAAENTDG